MVKSIAVVADPSRLASLVRSGAMRSAAHAALVLAPMVGAAACQSDVSTPFPPGLEPLEVNPVPQQETGPYVEELRLISEENPYVKIYARGYVLVAPSVLWAAAKNPEANMAACTTDEQRVTRDSQPEYEFSFAVHYTVHNFLTVQWDDQWRFGTLEGTIDAPVQALIKHQKVQGSDLIRLSEGTIDLLATEDPNVSELAFVEHLDAALNDVDKVRRGVRQNYQALVAVAHGQQIPPCP